MKKLVTLILVLAGIVGTASAANVTRRFLAIKQVGWENVYMYASYVNASSEEVAITAGWPGTLMTHWGYRSEKDVWYIDLNIPDGVSTIKVAFNNGSSGGGNQTWDYKNLDISSEDKLFYIYNDGGDDKNRGISPVTLDYYISGWKEEEDQSDNYRQKLTFNSDGTYTCDLDFTSYTATGNRVICPFFASGESEGYPWVDWNFVIRPQYSTAKIAFENKNSSLVWDGSQCWTFKNQVIYRCTFNFPAGTWTVEPYFTRNISAGYATFSSAYDVAVAGATAYYCTGVAGGELSMSEFSDGIPAGQGALLEGSGDVTFTPAASALSAPGTNWLKPGTGATVPQTDGAGNINFILTNKTVNGSAAALKFYKVNSAGNTVATGKAYLQIPSAYVGAHEYFWFEDETTGIETAKASQKTNGEFFNLAGQRVAQPAKGLYIVNGKKVIMK